MSDEQPEPEPHALPDVASLLLDDSPPDTTPDAPRSPGRGGRRRRGRRQDGPRTCYHCGQEGHIARDCDNDEADEEAREAIVKEKNSHRRCFNCGKTGHISAGCDKPAGKCCYNCGQEGHIARECPEDREE